MPPDVPVEQYWSATVYDRETHALVRHMDRASRSSQSRTCRRTRTARSTSGSARRLRRGKEANWVPTDPPRGFEVMFRLYAPTQALFDKTWSLPDIERVAPQQ